VLRELPIGTLSGGAGYCSALGVPIVAGRDIAPRDTIPGAPPVAVVSEQLARLLWAGESPLGRRFSLPERAPASAGAASRANPATAPPAPDDIEVVGVAGGDAVRRGVRGANVATIYLPSVRDPADDMMRPAYGLVVRTEAPADTTVAQFEKAARAVFPDAYTLSVTTPSRQVAEQMASERMGLTFFAWFSVVAVGLGVLGIWGLVAHAAASRTFELGVRAALGASPRALVWTVALGGIVPVAVGCLAGLVAAAGSTRLLASYLFEVSALDPLTLAGSTALLLMTGLVASLLPARRVLRLDPVAALRTE